MKLLLITGAVAVAITAAKVHGQLSPSALLPQGPASSIVEQPRDPKPLEPQQSTGVVSAYGTFQARGLGFGKLTLENWRSDWGSYDRDYERQQHVEVILSAWGHGKTEAEIQTLWFGREQKPNGKRVILNWTAQPVTLVGGSGPRSFICHSGVVKGSVQNYAALGERYGQGHKIEGWYVRLMGSNGQVFHDAASASFLADAGRNREELATLQDLSPRRR